METKLNHCLKQYFFYLLFLMVAGCGKVVNGIGIDTLVDLSQGDENSLANDERNPTSIANSWGKRKDCDNISCMNAFVDLYVDEGAMADMARPVRNIFVKPADVVNDGNAVEADPRWHGITNPMHGLEDDCYQSDSVLCDDLMHPADVTHHDRNAVEKDPRWQGITNPMYGLVHDCDHWARLSHYQYRSASSSISMQAQTKKHESANRGNGQEKIDVCNQCTGYKSTKDCHNKNLRTTRFVCRFCTYLC